MGKNFFRNSMQPANGSHAPRLMNNRKGSQPLSRTPSSLSSSSKSSASSDWLPESTLRDALIAERLPAAVADQTLFWINVRRYLDHQDAQLPPDDYLRHWREIYSSCLEADTSRLRGLSYVSFEAPATDTEVN
jgi:hypothetical protein